MSNDRLPPIRQRYLSDAERQEREERLRLWREDERGAPLPLEEQVHELQEKVYDHSHEFIRVNTRLDQMVSNTRGAMVASEDTRTELATVKRVAVAAVGDSEIRVMKHLSKQDDDVEELKAAVASLKDSRWRRVKEIATFVALVLAGLAALITSIKH